jgi:DNA-binding NtrC family response regulator
LISSKIKRSQEEIIEKAYIVAVLKETNGVISRAAKKAGVDRKGFSEKLRKYHIDAREFKRR